MSLGKKNIVKNVSDKAHLNNQDSCKLLNNFLKLIILKSDNNIIKISNFGTFYRRLTPERIGRNPRTKEEYIVTSRSKVNFRPSKNIKLLIN